MLTWVAPKLCSFHLLLRGFPSQFHLWNPVPVSITTAIMNHHDQRQAGKERVCFAYSSASAFITEGSQSRHSNNRTGTCRQSRYRGHKEMQLSGLLLVACFPWIAQTAISYHPGPPAQRWPPHNGLGPPASITKNINAL